MYFAVSKIMFDLDTETSQDDKALKSLAEKVRSRFKVAVSTLNQAHQGETALVIAGLARNEEKLDQTINDIMAFCEESGFGRISDELTLLDHIDSIADED